MPSDEEEESEIVATPHAHVSEASSLVGLVVLPKESQLTWLICNIALLVSSVFPCDRTFCVEEVD
jgi:hypothetical protein